MSSELLRESETVELKKSLAELKEGLSYGLAWPLMANRWVWM